MCYCTPNRRTPVCDSCATFLAKEVERLTAENKEHKIALTKWMSLHKATADLCEKTQKELAATQPSQQAGEAVDGVYALSPEASCLCCGNIGVPKAWAINRPAIYVCETCHRRANAAKDYQASNEAEGDAYTHGFFNGLEEAKQPIKDN